VASKGLPPGILLFALISGSVLQLRQRRTVYAPVDID
jgi:hypothetical protein